MNSVQMVAKAMCEKLKKFLFVCSGYNDIEIVFLFTGTVVTGW